MHRVELKELSLCVYLSEFFYAFLMHRVELKVIVKVLEHSYHVVPNAPCGVES